MNTIRNKLKHGFGHKKKSIHRQAVGQASVSASGSKPDKSIAEEPKSSSRRTRKTKMAKSTKGSSGSVAESDMDKKKTKSKIKNRKLKSFKHSKTCSMISKQECISDSNSAATNRVSSRNCDASHDGRLVLHTKLGIHVDLLFKWLFTQSEFFKQFQAKRHTTELQMGEWHTNKDGQRVRVISMTLALQASIGPKTSKIIEQQSLRNCSHAGELYSIDINCIHEGIPYADVFHIILHYCLVGVNNNNTELLVYATVDFIKPTWAVIKTFIMKHSFEGLAIYFSDINQELMQEIAKTKQ